MKTFAFTMAAVATVAVLAGCHKEKPAASEQALPTANVRATPARADSHLATEEVIGTVRPKLRATVEAKISGRIEHMLAVPGKAVKSGDLLAQLDVREIQAKVDQAKAVLQQADRELARFKSLLQEKTITQSEFDAVEARQRVAKASLTEVETMSSYARVVAPFNGVITRKLADVGDLAMPGKPLAEIEAPGELRLEADVPEALIDHVKTGATLPVRVASLTNELEGAVVEIAPSSDPVSRTFLVKLDLPSVAGLRAGQFGRVGVPIGESTVLRVPVSAVIQRGQLEIVFIVTNQHAQLRLVQTGKRFGSEIEVVSGVSDGEQAISEGAAQLRDGQPVQVRP
jgi:membrane fusion protein (multidrug efflux system)